MKAGTFHSEETKKRMRDARQGTEAPHWKGGRTLNDGYVYIHSPWHPNKNLRNYVQESRLIAEKVLGRYLKEDEIPHHINGIKDDNRNCNLLICTRSYHTWLHEKTRRVYFNFKRPKDKYGRFAPWRTRAKKLD